jgi:hypothetical protein
VNGRLIILVSTVAACWCGAQEVTNTPSVSALDEFMETGMEVAGIHAPYYDDAGVLKAELFGEQAKVLADGTVDITNLRIDIYEDKQVTITVFAPQCYAVTGTTADGRGFSAHSDGDVLISLDQAMISGRGFRFSSEDSRFEILNDAKVLVQGVARRLQELEQ